MKNIVPNEIISLYGIAAISRMAMARNEAALEKMPEVRKAMEEAANQSTAGSEKSIEGLDVENGGMADEFRDFMTAGFEGILPDEAKWHGLKFDLPGISEETKRCAGICAMLRDNQNTREIQQSLATQLEMLIGALAKNPNPIVVLFAALFKMLLAEIEENLRRLRNQAQGLWVANFEYNCGCEG